MKYLRAAYYSVGALGCALMSYRQFEAGEPLLGLICAGAAALVLGLIWDKT